MITIAPKARKFFGGPGGVPGVEPDFRGVPGVGGPGGRPNPVYIPGLDGDNSSWFPIQFL